jgi:glutamate-5-semialdehyde dehydrogenase
MSAIARQINGIARAARRASYEMAKAGTARKNRALKAIAAALRKGRAAILAANRLDMAAAEKMGLSLSMLDRLMLDEARIEGIARATESVAALPDPVGGLVLKRALKNGLKLEKRRVPLGVVGIVFESRPNVTVDAAALCLKSGNAVILRGGREAIRSNLALGRAIQAGLKSAGLPREAVSVISSTDRTAVRAMLRKDKLIDVIIPRGGHGLIRTVLRLSTIPVIRHDIGNCHVYVDKGADLEAAHKIAFNAKVSRPGVCNSMEHLLVHRQVAARFIPGMVAAYQKAGVEVRGDSKVRRLAKGVQCLGVQGSHRGCGHAGVGCRGRRISGGFSGGVHDQLRRDALPPAA